MRLSKRLRMNVSMVPEGARVADIGCDHGYASIWLVSERVARTVIALDINEGPISRAREHVRQAGLETQIACRRSDGAEKLEPGEVDTLMITGMGGPLMIRILEDAKAVMEGVDTLVLQPQSDLEAVRRYVRELGFDLAEEQACMDEGKYYFAMCAKRRKQGEKIEWSEDWQYWYGTYLVQKKDPVLAQYLWKERKKYDRILSDLDTGTAQRERKRELRHKINEIDKCLARMQFVPGSE